jgi:hypothetical protein
MVSPAYIVDDPTDIDIEKAARELYALFAATDNAILREEYAASLADLLGNPGEFHRYIRGNAGDLSERRLKLLDAFKHNMLLLVGKTWVDGHDEKRKEKTLTAIDGLAAQVLQADYPGAVKNFVKLSENLASLLFGESPADPGFMDYVARIDPKLGLFYWYLSKMKELETPAADLAKLQVLVGVYALSSF